MPNLRNFSPRRGPTPRTNCADCASAFRCSAGSPVVRWYVGGGVLFAAAGSVRRAHGTVRRAPASALELSGRRRRARLHSASRSRRTACVASVSCQRLRLRRELLAGESRARRRIGRRVRQEVQRRRQRGEEVVDRRHGSAAAYEPVACAQRVRRAPLKARRPPTTVLVTLRGPWHRSTGMRAGSTRPW